MSPQFVQPSMTMVCGNGWSVFSSWCRDVPLPPDSTWLPVKSISLGSHFSNLD